VGLMETRAEALAWCKRRALDELGPGGGGVDAAFASFASDIRKHPETAPLLDVVQNLGLPLRLSGHLSTPERMREWIEGFA